MGSLGPLKTGKFAELSMTQLWFFNCAEVWSVGALWVLEAGLVIKGENTGAASSGNATLIATFSSFILFYYFCCYSPPIIPSSLSATRQSIPTVWNDVELEKFTQILDRFVPLILQGGAKRPKFWRNFLTRVAFAASLSFRIVAKFIENIKQICKASMIVPSIPQIWYSLIHCSSENGDEYTAKNRTVWCKRRIEVAVYDLKEIVNK